MTGRATITRRAVEAAMRSVDGGKVTSVILRDARVPGLSISIGRRSQSWRLDYKLALPGGGFSVGKRLTLGDLGAVDIDVARQAAAEAKDLIGQGIDPVAAKRAKRRDNIEAAAGQTVAASIDRFIEERAPDWTNATRKAFRGDLRLIHDVLGGAPMAMVERGALVDLINDFLADQQAAGASGVRRAMRIAMLLGAIWKQAGPGSPSRPGWAWPGIDPQVADRLPVVGRHRMTSRRRVLSEAEIRTTWSVLRADRNGIGPAPRLVLMLSLATGLRIGAIALTRVADLDLDPERIVGARDHGPTIRIQAKDGTKATARERREGADILLPLSSFAVGLWREALALRTREDDFVFEGKSAGEHLATGTVSKAWTAIPVPADTVAHDLRRTMRTHLGDMDHGGTFEDEERLIGHSVGTAVQRTYDRGRKLARLRPLADAWGARLSAIVGAPAAQPGQLRGRA